MGAALTNRAGPAAGFTVVELMVTLAVGAILAMFAIPSFTSTIAHYRLSTDNGNLVSDLLLARSEAVRRGAAVSVCQSSDGATCTATGWTSGRIVFVDGGPAGQVDAGDTILKVSGPAAAGDTINATFPDSFIQYAPTGTVSVSGNLTTCRSAYNGLQAVIRPVGFVGTAKTPSVCP